MMKSMRVFMGGLDMVTLLAILLFVLAGATFIHAYSSLSYFTRDEGVSAYAPPTLEDLELLLLRS